MKTVYSCVLVALVVSQFCHAFDSSALKHASLGVGHLGLGGLCAYITYSEITRENKEGKNLFLTVMNEHSKDMGNSSLSASLFQAKSWKLHGALLQLFSSSLLISGFALLTCRRGISAVQSFKDAFDSLTKPEPQPSKQEKVALQDASKKEASKPVADEKPTKTESKDRLLPHPEKLKDLNQGAAT